MANVAKRKVAIVGAFTTPCRARWLSKTIWELAQWSVSGALQDAKMKVDRVEAGVIGLYNDIFARQAIPECSFLGHMGLAFKPLTRVTNGGATGIYAFGTAFDMVASGRHDVVLCVGAEKATDVVLIFTSETQTPEVVQTIAWSWDPLFERDQGATAADSYAEVILSYMDQHPNDLKMEVRGEILRIMCEQAKNNPNAQRRDEIVTPEKGDPQFPVDHRAGLQEAGNLCVHRGRLLPDFCRRRGGGRRSAKTPGSRPSGSRAWDSPTSLIGGALSTRTSCRGGSNQTTSHRKPRTKWPASARKM